MPRKRGATSRTTIATLERWIGASATAPLLGDPPYDALAFDVSALPGTLEQLPVLRTLAFETDVAAADVRIAQAEREPDWSFEVAYQQRGPDYSNMISIGISVPLPWNRAQRQDREVAARLARVDDGRARADAMRRYSAQLRTWFVEWESGRERILYHHHLVAPRAGSGTRVESAAPRGGGRTVPEVRAARRPVGDVPRSDITRAGDTARVCAPEVSREGPLPAISGRRGGPSATRTRETPRRTRTLSRGAAPPHGPPPASPARWGGTRSAACR